MEKLVLTDPAKVEVAATYNSAADHFDDVPLAFWDRFGRRTVDRLDLKAGSTVLDVGCGTGASALPAAAHVGLGGSVVGVDLADNLLELARAKAAERGLNNVEFRLADMTDLGFPAKRFDAVVSVFSIFFVPNMEALVCELWRMVRPGGKLAITTWGPRIFEPAYTVWRDLVRAERPDLYCAFNPWDRITSPEQMQELIRGGGVPHAEVVSESGRQPLRSPEDWWTVVMGSGLRSTMDAMDAETATRIHDRSVNWLRDNAIESIETNVIYGVAIKA